MPAENTKFSSISRAICYFVPRKSYSGKTRFHRWNDFDRLTFSLGHDFCGYYGYDADGIRTYKLTGTCNSSLLNGAKPMAQAIFDDVVLYPNPFVVVTPRGYTNHYYAGSERIASRIGEECWKTKPFDDFSELKPEWEALELFQGLSKEEYPFGTADDWNSSKIENITPYVSYLNDVQYQCGPIELPEVEVLYRGNELVDVMDCKFGCQGEDVVYYYHPDHLGSTSWVTNFRGDEQQFIAYMPYGEPLLDITFDKYDCRYGQDDARYKFTGKERDAETGYDYVEQRYYWWPGGFWLRPDPLLDKYLNLSPYAYCNGNPLKYVDPSGAILETIWDIANVAMDIASLKTNIGEGNIGGAVVDGVGLLLDAAAVVLPVVPGGAGTAIKTYRAADNVSNANKIFNFLENVKRGIQNEIKVLKDMGLTKNTTKIASTTDAGKPINVIPDAVQDGVMYEIKDTKAVYKTSQIQGEYNAAKEAGYEFKIVTGEKTNISSKIPNDVEIIRRSDLGPQ